jgi:hypothetical protein
VYAAAPRVEQQLLRAAADLDDRTEPMAETYRRLRTLAEEMGVPRPSYERVRLHLQVARRRETDRETARDLALELAFNTRSADHVIADLLDLVSERSHGSA